MKLLLIRHGQSEGNAAGLIQGQGEYPLSELGREQARRLGQRLSAEHDGIAAIYTSPQSRAAQTAEILAQAVDAPLVPDERLREYGIGELSGLTIEDVKERFPQIYKDWIVEDVEEWLLFPGAEENAHFFERVRQAFEQITARHDGDETVAIVSHGGTLSAYLAQIAGLAPERRDPFRIANASLSIVDLSRPRPRLARLNDTCHLIELEGE